MKCPRGCGIMMPDVRSGRPVWSCQNCGRVLFRQTTGTAKSAAYAGDTGEQQQQAGAGLVTDLRRFIKEYESTPITDGEALIVSLLGIATRHEARWQAERTELRAEVRNLRTVADTERRTAGRLRAQAETDRRALADLRRGVERLVSELDGMRSSQHCVWFADRLRALLPPEPATAEDGGDDRAGEKGRR